MTKLDAEKSQQPEIVTISIGTLFSYVREGILTNYIGVVMDFANNNSFQGAILREEDGEKYIGTPGTMGGDEFGACLGQLSSDELIEAIRLGKEKMNLRLTKADIDYIHTQTLKGPRDMELINRYYQRPKELLTEGSDHDTNHPV